MKFTFQKLSKYYKKQLDESVESVSKADIKKFVLESFSFDPAKIDEKNGAHAKGMSFIQFLMDARNPSTEKDGVKVGGHKLSLKDAIFMYYGVESVEEFFMDVFSINFKRHTFGSLYRKFAGNQAGKFTVPQLKDMLIDYTKYHFSAFAVDKKLFSATVGDYAPVFNFLIPEVYLEIIRADSDYMPKWSMWTGGSSFPAQNRTNTFVPYTREGLDGWAERGEAEDIRIGSEVFFDQKRIELREFATGARITDELLEQSTIDQLGEHFRNINRGKDKKMDALAITAIVNGETAYDKKNQLIDQSMPTIGVENPAIGWQMVDIQRVVQLMTAFGLRPNIMITRVKDQVKISAIPEYRGYNGETRTLNIENLAGRIVDLENTQHLPPADTIILLDSNEALSISELGDMVVEEERNSRNKTNEIFFSFVAEFFKRKRIAAVGINATVSYPSLPFPDYMDYDRFVDQSFFDEN